MSYYVLFNQGENRSIVAGISKCNGVLQNQYRYIISNMIYSPNENNSCSKYEQDPWNIVRYFCMKWLYIYIYIYIYIYYPLYTNWPITNTDLPHVIIKYILYFICQKLYWTVSAQLSNIGYIGQFQNDATGTLRTRYRRTEAVSMYLMKILSIFLHLRKILICFRIGWFL